MKKLPFIILALAILVVMEGFSWLAFRTSDDTALPSPAPRVETAPTRSEDPVSGVRKTESAASPSATGTVSQANSDVTAGFPTPTMETLNGRTERTIHMGVRQYVWEPATITAKQGELVRLIVHNADVLHGLVIPELGVDQDIPPDGAVIEFVASKAGSFEFFCSIWCGEGHMEMRGRLVVE